MAQSKKIIYLSITRLSDRIYNDYYIRDLIEKNIDVEFWDLVPLLRQEHKDAGQFEPEYLKYFRKWSDVEDAIKANVDEIFWLLVSHNRKAGKLFKLLDMYGVKSIAIEEAPRPLYLIKKSKAQKFLFYINHPIKLFSVLMDLFFLKYSTSNKVNIVFKTGKNTSQQDNNMLKVVSVNSIDYEKHLNAKLQNERVVNYRYALYLDSFMPHHNDNDLVGNKKLNADNYYQSLNNFFSSVEKKFSCKVVIAAHPSAIYASNPFDGRPIIRGKTAQLSQFAEVVFGDCSLSICYPILFKKPIGLLVSNEMISIYRHNSILKTIESYQSFLGRPIINIDTFEPEMLENILEIDEKKYSEYEDSFLTTSETRELKNIDIIIPEIILLMSDLKK